VEWSIFSPDSNLTTEPANGVLPAGANQDVSISRTLGIHERTVESILVVRVVGARDIFVTVTFNTYPTCLGASLDLLCHLPSGARNGMSDEPCTNMPREIFNCVDYLWNRIVKDMFWHEANASLRKQVLEWMDTGAEFDIQVLSSANDVELNSGVYAVAQTLLSLLRSLDGGIIPREYYYVVLKGRESASNILEAIPKVNVNVLIYLCGFLKRLLDYGIDEKPLLSLFEGIVISIPEGSNRGSKRRREFLVACIDGFM
jgi:hypothetical protein